MSEITETQRQVMVTGSSSGIGFAICRRLLAENYHVIGVSRTGNESQFDHAHFEHYRLDLSNIDELPVQLKKLTEKFPNLNGIIFNAGRGEFGSLEEFSYDQIKALMEINFLSHAYLSRAFLPLFKRRKSGDFIFIGSESGLSGARQGSVYCASKFAIRGMAQSLREECSRSSIRVSLINPGMVNSSFFDELDFQPGEDPENYIDPDDVAQAVSYVLASNPRINVDEINLSPMKHVVKKKNK